MLEGDYFLVFKMWLFREIHKRRIKVTQCIDITNWPYENTHNSILVIMDAEGGVRFINLGSIKNNLNPSVRAVRTKDCCFLAGFLYLKKLITSSMLTSGGIYFRRSVNSPFFNLFLIFLFCQCGIKFFTREFFSAGNFGRQVSTLVGQIEFCRQLAG